MSVREVTFIVGSSALARGALRNLAERFRTARETRSTSRREYFDTFDWRLYRDDGTLSAEDSKSGRLLRWQSRDGATRHRARVARVPDFARELDAGAFRDELIGIAGIRRLLPVVNLELTGESIAVLDRREKTVARVHHERGSASAGSPGRRRPLVERLRVVPVLGYDRDHRAVVRHLEQVPGVDPQDGNELDLSLAAIGKSAAVYTSKLNVLLEPEMRADEATRRILMRLLETMRANEDGTSRDLDPEFLHDFRVAVRRTRSCLGQVKGLFDRGETDRFRREFAWLGRATGRTRDLDVWLLKIGEYRGHVPASLHDGVDDFENWLRKQQRAEQRKVARALGGRRYRDLTRDWARFLNGQDSGRSGEQPPNAKRNVREVASERIGRAYARVRKRGSALADDTRAEAVHRLRIDCKKLRYLLEFFGTVFGQERVAPFVRSLKRLQDQLGDFNDFDVQHADLRQAAAVMIERGASSSDTVLAMGCLAGKLAERQGRLKKKLIGSVRTFLDETGRARLQELLG